MLVLATNSAARNALLAGAGLTFESSPARIDERAEHAGKRNSHLAEHAADVAESHGEDFLGAVGDEGDADERL